MEIRQERRQQKSARGLKGRQSKSNYDYDIFMFFLRRIFPSDRNQLKTSLSSRKNLCKPSCRRQRSNKIEEFKTAGLWLATVKSIKCSNVHERCCVFSLFFFSGDLSYTINFYDEQSSISLFSRSHFFSALVIIAIVYVND